MDILRHSLDVFRRFEREKSVFGVRNVFRLSRTKTLFSPLYCESETGFSESLVCIVIFCRTTSGKPMYYPKISNQELSVLYGGLTLNYGEQLSLYIPYMLCVSMTADLAHLQFSDLQGETRPICRTSHLQGERILICRT